MRCIVRLSHGIILPLELSKSKAALIDFKGALERIQHTESLCVQMAVVERIDSSLLACEARQYTALDASIFGEMSN